MGTDQQVKTPEHRNGYGAPPVVGGRIDLPEVDEYGPPPAASTPTAQARTCAATGCGRNTRRRGLCGAHYGAWRTRQHAYGWFVSDYVDPTPVRTHVRALQTAGLGERRIAELAGLHRTHITSVNHGRSRTKPDQPSTKISTRVAEAILAVPIPGNPVAVAAAGACIDSTGTVRRLQALVALGYPAASLGERIGVSVSNTAHTLRATRVTVRRARQVAVLYEQLSHVPGESTRARMRAQRQGWAPPLAWDEDTIDDPTASPASPVDTDTDGSEAALDEVLLDRLIALRASILRPGGHINDREALRRHRVLVPRTDRHLYTEALQELGWSAMHIADALGSSTGTTRVAA